MHTKMEQYLAENFHPALSITKDGTVIYSNEAGEPLLNEWGIDVGEKLPSNIEDILQRVLYLNTPEIIEIKVVKRTYLVAFHPSSKEELVNVYAFDKSNQKEFEENLLKIEMHIKFSKTVYAERRWLYDVLDMLPLMICLVTSDYHVAFANLSFRKKYGEPDNRQRYVYFFGRTKPCEFCNLPFTDVDNSPVILKMKIDITEGKKAERALNNIENARKKEIHHRIKNNLQVISSLLDLQAEKFKGKIKINESEVLEAFRESQDRVISMALIHEELYKGREIDTVNFSHYIQELADNLFLTYRLGSEGISLDMDIEEDIFLDMDTSVPLGIIINELVSNSLKHAFYGRENGEIKINLHKEECKTEDCKSTKLILSVSDNGIGIPQDLDIEDIDSLGLQLVTTLVNQLDGKLELKSNNGAEFIIRFTVTENNNLASTRAQPHLVDNE